MKIVCISDTHELHHKIQIPECDLLIHAGDFTGRGHPTAIASFNAWLKTVPAKHKVICAGNHDLTFEDNPVVARSLITNAIYLEDSFVVIDGFKIYASPHQPEFCDWGFNLPRGEALKKKWDLIPDDTDILITHSPPYGYGDKLDEHGSQPGQRVGCEELIKAVDRVKPKLHVFGHIHCGYGQYLHNETLMVNASSCDEQYRPINSPIVVEI